VTLHPLGLLSPRARVDGIGEMLMGRTIPSWRMVLEEECRRLTRFKQFLRPEERAVFDDLLNQCRLYATQAGCLASPVKEVPLLLSMIFGQHKRLVELERGLFPQDELNRRSVSGSRDGPILLADLPTGELS
jgi:hypothetical protein